MGEVYRAHDPRLKRDVAVKVLLPAVARDADRLARFEPEAQILTAGWLLSASRTHSAIDERPVFGAIALPPEAWTSPSGQR